ncbi:MAG: phasin family protein [Granulosicoccus sp.]|nr:phasin family protein [Granulosicoccus sp.]
MKSVNEQFAEMQKKTLDSLEPVKNMNSVAAEAFERIARKNYDLMGDLVDYAVAQVKMPSTEANLQDVYEKRVADTKAFAEKVNERAAEYVALAGELGELVQSKAATGAAAAKPAAAKAPAAKKKAAPKKTAAKSK